MGAATYYMTTAKQTASLLRGVILSVSLHLFLPNLVMFKPIIHVIFAVIGPALHIC